MRGSLLVTFDGLDFRGGDYYDVTVNNQKRYIHYNKSNNLYSTFLNTGDVVTVDIFNDSIYTANLSLIRKDYTTDDEGGDRGIKETQITSTTGTTGLSLTFTASTRNDAYSYDYLIGGEINDCFDIGSAFNANVFSSFVSNNKIYIGGNFNSYNSTSVGRIVKLNLEGDIDTSINFGSGFNNLVLNINVQSDDKILVGGTFTQYSGVTRNRIVRLNSDGTMDTGFTIGSGFNSTVNVIEIQSDGKILVGGIFTSYNGTSLGRIVRLNTNGTIDTGFTITFDSIVRAIKVQPDGKILVGGEFIQYNGLNTARRIIRLNSDGTVDPSFSSGTGVTSGFNSNVRTIDLQSDGKILVGGEFVSYNNSSAPRIVRLNTDGSIDTTFNSGTGFGSIFPPSIIVYDIKILSNDKILVGGEFTLYDNITSNRFIKLNSDGTIDNSFNINNGFDSYIWTIGLQSDGKILLGGQFNSYNDNTRNRIIRLNSDGTDNTC